MDPWHDRLLRSSDARTHPPSPREERARYIQRARRLDGLAMVVVVVVMVMVMVVVVMMVMMMVVKEKNDCGPATTMQFGERVSGARTAWRRRT